LPRFASASCGFRADGGGLGRGFALAGTDRPERAEGAIVSADFFSVLSTPPLVGRALTVPASAPPASQARRRSPRSTRRDLTPPRHSGSERPKGSTGGIDGPRIRVRARFFQHPFWPRSHARGRH